MLKAEVLADMIETILTCTPDEVHDILINNEEFLTETAQILKNRPTCLERFIN